MAGVFEVVVERTGYRPWSRANVRIRQGRCHVKTVSLTALLQPQPWPTLPDRNSARPWTPRMRIRWVAALAATQVAVEELESLAPPDGGWNDLDVEAPL